MPDVKYSLTRGAGSNIDNTTFKDGQILFDREAGRILLDAMVSNVPTRIVVKEGIFDGTTDQWESLTDSQKALFKYVNLTDGDYNPYSANTLYKKTLAVGATTVTFTNLPTTGDNVVNFYTSNGINYTAIDTSVAGQVTLTFDAQSSNVTVCCEIKGV